MHKHPLRRSALALAALGAVTACQHSDDQNSPGPSEVSVVTLTAAPANLVTELPGRTNAFMMSDVRPQIGGIVLRRLFEEGSIVSTGQLQIGSVSCRERVCQYVWLSVVSVSYKKHTTT